MRPLLLTLLVLVACPAVNAEPAAPLREQRPATLTTEAVTTLRTETDRALRSQPTTDAPDPYADWQRWCEPSLPVCKTAKDCERVRHPSGKSLKCIRPWYAEKDSGFRVCSPGWSSRTERLHQKARIRELVRLQYSGEEKICADADPGWRCGHRRRRGDQLARFLNMVAHRETTMRPWKRHRLNGDIRANRRSYARTRKLYAGNKHRGQRSRWEYGLGLYGMNASLFTKNWSTKAPPEILCREVEGTEAYLRSARKAWRKLSGGIDCDGIPGREWHGVVGKPTWYDVHRYASSGKACADSASLAKFEARARRAGLKPFEPIELRDLGIPIETRVQDAVAQLRTAQIEVFSSGWMLQQG